MLEITSPSPASSALVEHIAAQSGSLPFARRLRPYFVSLAARLFRSAAAEGAFVHLAAAAEIAGLRILRRAEPAGVEAIAAADAEILGMQHHPLLGLVEAVDRADRYARRVRAMHAGDRDRALAGLAVVERDHATAVHPHGTLCSFLQAVTQALHSMQRSASQRNFMVSPSRFLDAAERGLGLLHLRLAVAPRRSSSWPASCLSRGRPTWSEHRSRGKAADALRFPIAGGGESRLTRRDRVYARRWGDHHRWERNQPEHVSAPDKHLIRVLTHRQPTTRKQKRPSIWPTTEIYDA